VKDEHTVRWLVSDEASTEHRYEPGAVILREGENGDSIYLIGSGSAEAVLSASGGETIVLSVMQTGETFGEMGFFERKPRSATVRAREACLVLEIKGQALRSLADAHPELGFKILLQVSERLRSKNEQVLTLHLKSMKAANRAKDEFVAMLGHELRNPARRHHHGHSRPRRPCRHRGRGGATPGDHRPADPAPLTPGRRPARRLEIRLREGHASAAGGGPQ
jgi:CRP-like cAMP-binding protein